MEKKCANRTICFSFFAVTEKKSIGNVCANTLHLSFSIWMCSFFACFCSPNHWAQIDTIQAAIAQKTAKGEKLGGQSGSHQGNGEANISNTKYKKKEKKETNRLAKCVRQSRKRRRKGENRGAKCS